MLASQSIYGPHDSAQWDAGNIALGRCLFRTLPEDAHDRQPFLGRDERYVLVADLRLDNRDELISALQLPAERARAMADAAVLLAAWERWQEGCLDRIVGDYAFALWDASQRRLILARDPMGLRPLHYHRGRGFFAFASMPKGLHALADIPRAPDEVCATETFALLPEFGPRSFFKGIERVELGRIVIVSGDHISTRKHWTPVRDTIRLSSADEYAEALRAHVDEAVRARLRGASKSVGAHLSAGLDSSSIAATAARLLAPSGGKVTAFTSVPRKGYDRPDMRGRLGDEGPLAAATAALYPNIEHVLIRVAGRTPLDNLDRNFFLFERPIINICNQAWFDALNAAARDRKLTVMLAGSMGNFTMSYDGMALLPELIARGHVLRWLKQARALVRRRHMSWRWALGASFGPWIPTPLWVWLRRFARGDTPDISDYTVINKQRYQELDLHGRARERGMDLALRPRANGFDLRLWGLERTDVGNYHKGWLAGWGIDVRDASTDRRLVEFCLAVPMEQYLSDGVLRALAHRAFADRLPKEVLEERRRGLQMADWHEHMTAARDGMREEVERLEQNLPAATSLDISRMRQLVENWPSEGWERDDVYTAYRLALLRGISCGHFLRRASGSNA